MAELMYILTWFAGTEPTFTPVMRPEELFQGKRKRQAWGRRCLGQGIRAFDASKLSREVTSTTQGGVGPPLLPPIIGIYQSGGSGAASRYVVGGGVTQKSRPMMGRGVRKMHG
jgi:hypothetical protein